MQSKSLLIAIATFAVTASGVQGYAGAKVFTKAGLDDWQVSAIVAAGSLQASGDELAARNVLISAGVTEDTLLNIQYVARQSDMSVLDDDFTLAQEDVYEFALQNNDRATMQAVLEEVGL